MTDPLFNIVNIDDVMTADLAAPKSKIGDFAPTGHVTVMGSHGGVGKSNTALQWCVHHAAGRSWAGLPVEQGRSAFISLEDPAYLVRFRLRKIIEAYELEADAVLRNLLVLDGSEYDTTLAT